jgi:plasmid stability protein
MSTMIQIRNVPDDVHRRLKVRAAIEGLSLSEYLVREMTRVAERPTIAEMRQRLEQRAATKLKTPPADAVRRERDHR